MRENICALCSGTVLIESVVTDCGLFPVEVDELVNVLESVGSVGVGGDGSVVSNEICFLALNIAPFFLFKYRLYELCLTSQPVPPAFSCPGRFRVRREATAFPASNLSL